MENSLYDIGKRDGAQRGRKDAFDGVPKGPISSKVPANLGSLYEFGFTEVYEFAHDQATHDMDLIINSALKSHAPNRSITRQDGLQPEETVHFYDQELDR